jgi:hypothetical protein
LAGRTPQAAVTSFVEPLPDILRCITDVGFAAEGRRPGGPYAAFFLGRTARLRRRHGLDPLSFRVALDYTIDASTDRVGWWDTTIVGWVFEVHSSADRPIVDFHWHPRNSGRVTYPHLHAYGSNDAVDLHKLHPPTGPVTASSVVRFLIDDLDVLPRRPNWQAVLDRHAAV